MIDWLKPIDLELADDDQKKTIERARKKLLLAEDAPTPEWVLIMANSPSLLKDTYMNLDRAILSDTALSKRTKLILATTTASHAGVSQVAQFFAQLAIDQGVSPAHLYEASAIAATSTSFNFYYKFRSLYEGQEFDGYSPGLRASLFVNPEQGKAMAELINLIVSTINGCKSCVNGHVADALKHDLTREQIDEALRTSAIIMGICTFVRRT